MARSRRLCKTSGPTKMPTIRIAALKSRTICLLLVTLSMITNLRAVLGQESLAQDVAAVGSGSPRFEVASIRPHAPGYWPTFDLFRFTPDGFKARNIRVMIRSGCVTASQDRKRLGE